MGLVLIGIGSGGIKPCVMPLGADQFTLPQQENHLAFYFGVYYALINVGEV